MFAFLLPPAGRRGHACRLTPDWRATASFRASRTTRTQVCGGSTRRPRLIAAFMSLTRTPVSATAWLIASICSWVANEVPQARARTVAILTLRLSFSSCRRCLRRSLLSSVVFPDRFSTERPAAVVAPASISRSGAEVTEAEEESVCSGVAWPSPALPLARWGFGRAGNGPTTGSLAGSGRGAAVGCWRFSSPPTPPRYRRGGNI